MLPLPIPMMHRHDEIGSPEKLACHLATRHQRSICDGNPIDVATYNCEGPTLNESHWQVRSPSEGVLEEVLVKTGDKVSQGQALAQLRSPPIGDARSRILSSESNLELAEKAFQWETSLQGGIDHLTTSILAGVSPESIRDTLRDQVLGDSGGQLLQQYSRSELATRLARSVGSVADSGAISGRVIRERTSAQQQAQAELEASMEQTLFQAKQARDTAEVAVEAAKRDLQIAKQSLSTLLGATASTSGELDVSPNDPDLSRLTIRSPLAGTVERKVYSATERVTPQSDLFVIADTSILWVEADIRSRDWDSIAVTPGDTVIVSTPSIPGPPGCHGLLPRSRGGPSVRSTAPGGPNQQRGRALSTRSIRASRRADCHDRRRDRDRRFGSGRP